MANVKINNNSYMNKEKVKLVNADDESQFVTFSIGGGGGGTSVNKVLYANGNDVLKMLQNDGGQAYVDMFPTCQTITSLGGYTQQVTEASTNAWSSFPTTVYLYRNYGVAGTEKIDPAGLTEYDKIGICRLNAGMSYFTDYSNLSLQDTGVTIDIGGYPFHEAIIVEDGE